VNKPVAALPGLYDVIDGVHRAAAANPQAYFNCGRREQVSSGPAISQRSSTPADIPVAHDGGVAD
jgi:hypothetical protein